MSKTKEDRKKKLEDSDDDSDSSGPADRVPAAKKPKAESSKKGDEEPSWDLGKNRFVKVRTFKGTTYVDIREFYEDGTGTLKPGKKGISLTTGQWQKFKSIFSEVDETVKDM